MFPAMTLPGNSAPLYLANPTRTTYLSGQILSKFGAVVRIGLLRLRSTPSEPATRATKPYSAPYIFADHHGPVINRCITILSLYLYLSPYLSISFYNYKLFIFICKIYSQTTLPICKIAVNQHAGNFHDIRRIVVTIRLFVIFIRSLVDIEHP